MRVEEVNGIGADGNSGNEVMGENRVVGGLMRDC